MRNFPKMAGFSALLLALAAGVASAGPWERTAASKADGDLTGRETLRRNATYRAYSVAPAIAATVQAAATTGTINNDGNTTKNNITSDHATESTSAARQNSATRSFSYQPAPANQMNRSNRQKMPGANNFHADHKALGEY